MHKVKELYRAIDIEEDKRVKLELLYELAKLLINIDLAKSEEVATELLELAIAEGEAEHVGNAYLLLGNLRYNAMLLSEAEEHYLSALKNYPPTANKLGVARTEMALGMLYWTRGEHNKALDIYQPLLSIEGSSNEFYAFKAHLLTNIGNVYVHQGDLDKTEQYYLQALKVMDDAGLGSESMHIRANLASLEGSRGNYADAIEQLHICLEGFKQQTNKHMVALVSVNLAAAYAEQKLYAEALLYYQQSLKMFKDMNDDNTVVNVLAGISKVYVSLQGFKEALTHANKAIDLAKVIGFPAGVLDAMLAKCRAYIGLCDLVNAKKVYHEAKELAQEKSLKMDFDEQDMFHN